jgi:hypothetical protein
MRVWARALELSVVEDMDLRSQRPRVERLIVDTPDEYQLDEALDEQQIPQHDRWCVHSHRSARWEFAVAVVEACGLWDSEPLSWNGSRTDSPGHSS